MLLAPLGMLALSHAAEVTDLPVRGHIEASLGYRGFSERGGLEEGGTRVSERRFSQHDLVIGAAYAPFPWGAVTLDIITTPSMRWTFPDSRAMQFDPVSEAGTTLLDDATTTVEQRAAGVHGVWLGAAVTPWSMVRGDRSTWRVDVAFRAPAGTVNQWSARDNGVRGAAPGGAALRLGVGFSREAAPVEPYLQVRWVQELAATIQQTDELGRDWGLLGIRPSSTVVVRTGAEWDVSPAAATVGITIDGWIGGEYRGPGRVASGVLLPSVLDSGRAVPAVVDAQVGGQAGLGVGVSVVDVGEIRLGMRGRWATPYRVEHLYDVHTTPDTWGLGGFITLSRAFDIKGIIDDVE